jgi:hypothetical protein
VKTDCAGYSLGYSGPRIPLRALACQANALVIPGGAEGTRTPDPHTASAGQWRPGRPGERVASSVASGRECSRPPIAAVVAVNDCRQARHGCPTRRPQASPSCWLNISIGMKMRSAVILSPGTSYMTQYGTFTGLPVAAMPRKSPVCVPMNSASRAACPSSAMSVLTFTVASNAKGLAGTAIERYAAEQVGVLLARPDRRDEQRRFGNLAGVRQWIESVNDTLKGQLDLEGHGGRTPAGVYARVAQRLLALTAAIWHNWRINAEVKRSLIAYDH